MKFISATVHGYIDYFTGLVIAISPWIFNFSDNLAAKSIAIVMGIGAIGYSAFTNYKPGIYRLIPMSAHLWLDGLSGTILIVASLMMELDNPALNWFIGVGAAEILIALFTRSEPMEKSEHDEDLFKDRIRTKHQPGSDKTSDIYTGTTTQGGSNFGQGSSQLSGKSYQQGNTRNEGSNYDNEREFPAE